MENEGQSGWAESPALAEELSTLRARVAALEEQMAALQGGAVVAPPPPKPVASLPAGKGAAGEPRKKVSLEDRIGSEIFGRVGIVALMVAATWFLKLAIDNHLVGPVGRVLIGLIAGAGIIVWSEHFRRRSFAKFSYSLKAIGTGVLYLSLWAAFQLYQLLPAEAALVLMILVTAWIAFMAWSQNAEVLAAYALAGGLATPLLLHTSGDHEVFLFTYLLAISVATVALVRLRGWPRLLPASIAAVVAYFIGWYVPYGAHAPLALTLVFVGLFGVVYGSVAVRGVPGAESAPEVIGDVLVPMANAAFVALGAYSLLQDSGNHEAIAWVMLLLAAVYLGVMRLRQTGLARGVHLTLAVTLLTIAIPLKTSGRWIVVGWLAEGVALLFVAGRLAAESGGLPSRLLRVLGAASLLIALLGIMTMPWWVSGTTAMAFWNANFAAALVGLAAYAAAVWLALHAAEAGGGFPTNREVAGGATIAFNLVAIVAVVREISDLWNRAAGGPEVELQRALAISAFLMLYGAALLAVGFWKRTAFVRWQALLVLVFTIAKVFVYDMRNLNEGYRAVSFLGLGLLLTAVSFAYQKDWLALRDAPVGPARGVETKDPL